MQFLREVENMRKIFLDKTFDPLDMIMTGPIMERYAIKSEDINIPFDKFIKNTSNYTNSDFEFYKKDLRHSIATFFCSYKYKYGEKTTPNTFIRQNYERFKCKTPHSAQSIIDCNKRMILEGNRYLKEVFGDTFDNMKKRRSNTLSKIDANVFSHSIRHYLQNPTYLLDSNGTERLYNITTLQKFMSETNFTNVEEYIFERIYHVKLICGILDFYYEFKHFIDRLSDDVFSLGISIYKKQRSGVYKYKCFVEGKARQALRKYGIKNVLNLETLKAKARARLEDLIVELCRFSLIDDVYTRIDKMKKLIEEIIPDIMDENACLNKIKQCVSREFRNSIIADDVFYYTAINYSMSEYSKRKLTEYSLQDEMELIRNLIINKDMILEANGYYLKETIDGLENCIKSTPFDLKLKEVVSHTTDEDSILHKLLFATYCSTPIKQKNEDFYGCNFFDDKFYAQYRELLDNQMNRVIESKKLDAIL